MVLELLLQTDPLDRNFGGNKVTSLKEERKNKRKIILQQLNNFFFKSFMLR